MTIKLKLDPILEKWDLLKHPFYQAWSAGTLPVDALRVYAREYAGLINMLPRGWEALGDPATAEEEREHAALWTEFTSAVGGTAGEPTLQQTRELVQSAEILFSAPDSALGALYAFEAQQPATSKSKLEGLKAHYDLPAEVQPYFEIHSANWHESEKILAAIDTLSPDAVAKARQACEQMAQSLWNALSGIHEEAMGKA